LWPNNHGSSPVGRFAPSPTGDLHFGSLLAAVASYLQAKASGGHWLVRVEDIDPPREKPGSAARILSDLKRFGLQSDLPVLYQSTRRSAYQIALRDLLDRGLAFRCGCSRSDLPSSGVYPGTCRAGLRPGRRPRTVRLRIPAQSVSFTDQIQGEIRENLEATVGDFVLWRADGLPAYHLAAVVDDAFQQVTQVVRGADLLASTARQIHLQRCLSLPTPIYAHHPVATGTDGKKLSKRLGSDPLACIPTEQALEAALRFLGQPCPAGRSLESLWDWALQHWDLSLVPHSSEIRFVGAADCDGQASD
jgi:glutamyl-Q tRNA(Asp) synthetase